VVAGHVIPSKNVKAEHLFHWKNVRKNSNLLFVRRINLFPSVSNFFLEKFGKKGFLKGDSPLTGFGAEPQRSGS
jgi:hypothetical protein